MKVVMCLLCMHCRTIYIQLASPRSFVDLYRHTQDRLGKDSSFAPDARTALNDNRHNFARALLLLLLTSHVVIWVQEANKLGTEIVQQLRSLQVSSLITQTIDNVFKW